MTPTKKDTSSLSWQFLKNEADESEGLGHAGIETFKDAPYAGIARECGQNSADAKVSNPVKMTFDVIEIARKEFPILEEFEKHVHFCLEKAKAETDEKATDFFQKASEVISADSIKMLRVSDYSTKGLLGPCEKGTPFHSLVKATGVSTKESDTSGGSFGIGKNAAFALSELQTVFYASRYISVANSLEFIAQGKAILVSHVDSEENALKATGYWGLSNFKAVTDPNLVPQWMRRDERGTSIFSIGFRDQPKWQFKMAASLLSNFFCAIERKEMVFELNHAELKINHESVPDLFNDEIIQRAAEENSEFDQFNFARSLYQCLVSPNSVEKFMEHKVLGKVSIKIEVKEGLPKRIGIIRNGMIITDNLEHFNHKFARFQNSKDFIAVIEIQDDKGNAVMKKLENPRHDGLSAERISDKKKREEAYTAMRELGKFIKDSIKEETITVPENQVEIDELTEFFADDDERKKSKNPEDEDDIETFTYQVSTKPSKVEQPTIFVRKKKKPKPGEENAIPKPNHDDPDPNPKKTKIPLTPVEPSENREFHQVEMMVKDIRNIIVKKEQSIIRKIYFTSPKSCDVAISLFAPGLNEAEELTLKTSSNGVIEGNRLITEVESTSRNLIEVETYEDYEGPIEVAIYSLKKKG